MKPIKPVILAVIFSVSLLSCSTQQKQNAVDFANSPTGQLLIKSATAAIVEGVLSVGTQYATKGKVTGRGVVKDLVAGSVPAKLRELKGEKTVSTTTVQDTVAAAVPSSADAGISLGAVVATQAKSLEVNGIASNTALEVVAAAVEKGVDQLESK